MLLQTSLENDNYSTHLSLERNYKKMLYFKIQVSKSWIYLETELILSRELFWSIITVLTFYLMVTASMHVHAHTTPTGTPPFYMVLENFLQCHWTH